MFANTMGGSYLDKPEILWYYDTIFPPTPGSAVPTLGFEVGMKGRVSKCVNGHALQPHTTAHGNHACDVCQASPLPPGTAIQRCAECDFDVCARYTVMTQMVMAGIAMAYDFDVCASCYYSYGRYSYGRCS